MKIGQFVILSVLSLSREAAGKSCRRSRCGRRLWQCLKLWEVSALRASVLVQRLCLLGHINPGAIGWCTGLGGSVPVGMGRFETGRVQSVWFSVLFLYFIGPCAEFDFHNKALKFVRFAHWDLRSYAAAAP